MMRTTSRIGLIALVLALAVIGAALGAEGWLDGDPDDIWQRPPGLCQDGGRWYAIASPESGRQENPPNGPAMTAGRDRTGTDTLSTKFTRCASRIGTRTALATGCRRCCKSPRS